MTAPNAFLPEAIARAAALERSISLGHWRKALAAIDAAPDDELEIPVGTFGKSLLMVALDSQQDKVAERLLDRGVSVNFTSHGSKDAALFSALRRRHMGWVNRLLDAGADPAACRALGESAIGVLLHRFPENPETEAETQRFVVRLLAAGACVDAGSITPLMAAASHGHEGMVRFFLGYGASPHVVNSAGNTAFMFAARAAAISQNPSVLRLLRNAGADAGVVNHEGLRAADFYEKNRASQPLLRRGLEWAAFVASKLDAVDLDQLLPSSSAPVESSRSRLRF